MIGKSSIIHITYCKSINYILYKEKFRIKDSQNVSFQKEGKSTKMAADKDRNRML